MTLEIILLNRMPDTMDAVVCRDFEEWNIEEVPKPSPGKDDVLISVERVQLSVTECQRYYGKEVSNREKIHQQMKEGDGRVFGHEFSGNIVEKGENVTQYDIGDRVYAPAKISCGDCPYCTSGYSELCDELTTIGNGRPGALAEYLSVPASVLQTLPGGITCAEAAALQPLASAMLCSYDAHIETGDTVAVIGMGVMGDHVGQLSFLEGAGEVFAIDILPKKLKIAEKHGMKTIDARDKDPVATVREATGGIGADVVFPAVGGDQSRMTDGEDPIGQAFNMVRKNGTILQVGIIQGDLVVSPRAMRSKEIRWLNPRHGSWSLGPNSNTGKLAGELVASGRIDVTQHITHELEGLESFEKAVDITTNKEQYNALGPAQIIID